MTDSTDAEAAEELLNKSKEQRRHSTDPSTDSESTGDSPTSTLQESIRAVYDELDAGTRSPNLTVRDDDLSALIVGVENSGELERVVDEVYSKLDREPEEKITRATLLKGLIRLGLADLDPEVTETAVEAKREHLAGQADGF